MLFFVFFKQKTAYEMRISDWSSDVCSSDLTAALCRSRPKSVLSRSRARDCRGPRIRGRAHSGCPEIIRDKKDRRDLSPRALPKRSTPFDVTDREIGRASCRERVCQYV